MAKVRIVTDSTADIPNSLVKELDIVVVPLKVMFGQETFQDRVNLSPEQFFQRMSKEDNIPTTSQPTPHEFETVYQRIAEKEQENPAILSIHISSQLSGTYQSAKIAADECKKNLDITVIDSKRASYALGMIVVETAKLAKNGASKRECIDKLQHLLSTVQVYFMVDSLTYLQKNGRIGKASALVGSLLNMKPILSLTDEGQVYPYDKARGKKKAFRIIKEACIQHVGHEPVHFALIHADAFVRGKELVEQIKPELNIKSEVTAEIGAVIGSHAGPGTVAIALMPADEQ